MPLVWADPATCDPPGGTYDVVKNIPGDYSAANAQQAFTDWAAAADQWWHVIVAAGTVVPKLTVPAKSVGTAKPTKCIKWSSSTPLTAGRIACAGGIQDNLASATDPGVRNPDCNGSSMTYQSGMSLTSIPSGAFTLANGTNTNTSAYNDVAKMWTVECTTVNCDAIAIADPDVNGNGPSHFAFEDMEVRLAGAATCCTLINTHNGSTTIQGLPSDYGLKRVWVHGDATDAGSGSQSLSNDFFLDCGTNCWLVDSQASKSIRPGAEGHVVLVKAATGMLISHNWFEGQSIGVFAGGFNGPALTSTGASMQDSAVLRTRFTYPLPWLGNSPAICGGSSCTRKNGTELKGGVRVVLDGNILENIDNSGAQSGVMTTLNVRACSSSTGCDNYLQTITDITQTNNVFRNGCHGVTWDGNSGSEVAGVSVALGMARVNFSNNLIYNNGVGLPGCSGTTPEYSLNFSATGNTWLQIPVTRDATGTIATAQLYQGATVNIATIQLTGNVVTVTTSTPLPQAPRAGGANVGSWVDIEGVTPSTLNGVYRLCDVGTATCISPTVSTFTYQKTLGNVTGSGGTVESFVGEAQSNVNVGDAVKLSNCVDTTFNVPAIPNVLAIAPTAPTGTTVIFPNTGTPNASTTCDYTNAVGQPDYMTIRHNTVVNSLTTQAPYMSQTVPGANFPNRALFVDNIFTGGGFKSGAGEGTATENSFFNTALLGYHHNVQSDRALTTWQANHAYRIGDTISRGSPNHRYVVVTSGTSSAVAPTFTSGTATCVTDNTVVWQEIGLNPTQFGGGYDYTEYLTFGAIGVRPPVTVSFPATTYCYAGDPMSSCVGFTGGLNAPTTGTNSCVSSTVVPSPSIQPVFNLLDWHDYVLHSSSVFHNAASDGSDMGANISSIENAQTRVTYPH